ncbi:MAG: hypothetical protein GXX96_32855 [Planctomycetaceae bacterium]|nr:hypothetical protein [Planctomycetaceae bacterium]
MLRYWPICLASACLMVASPALAADVTPTSPVTAFKIAPTSLVSRDQQQRIDLSMECAKPIEACTLRIWSGERPLAEKPLGPLAQGANDISVLLDEPKELVETRWELANGVTTLAETTLTWTPPRHWTLYVLKSSHVDIGLHDSQYKQRFLTDACLDEARNLAEQTADWPDASRFRYVVEGLWWWFNYPQDRSERLADELVSRYVKPGLFGIGASHSGNHTQVFSVEELCRSTYYARSLRNRWNVPAETMLMVDNNGISWPLVTVFADAGIKNLVFLPNAWNPGVQSKYVGWGRDGSRDHMGAIEEAGGSRIDVGWLSPLPHVFYWRGPDKASKILVWTNPTYTSAGHDFGLQAEPDEVAESKMARQLAKLEARYPYDLWLVSFYSDNEKPSLGIPSFTKEWNTRWRWPELRTLGDLSEPFREIEKRFADRIPTLSGMVTGGWAQHPASTPTLLARKLAADRLLPVAEKLATLARLVDPGYIYPSTPFRRAWDALVCNDEHGYGTSYYRGRPVYDTWMQKRDWIERALAVGQDESTRALKALAASTPADSPSVFVFNPTLQPRSEVVEVELPQSCAGRLAVRCPDGTPVPATASEGKLRFLTSKIPPMGYVVFPLLKGDAKAGTKRSCHEPPSIENTFYRVTFKPDGSIGAIFDKTLGRELVDSSASYGCNQFAYTRDGHKNFSSPSGAQFEIETSPLAQSVIARLDDPVSGAAIQQRVTLPAHEKRIDIDNRLDHVRDLAGKDRWHRFGYYAFPFDVPNARFRVGLNGCSADPYKDQTGHGTDAYHAARDWSHVGNEQFGITLVQVDSQLVECGWIHPKKNTFGDQPNSSHLYSYIFNDWLYAHAYVTGPSHINLRDRYAITTHQGPFQAAHAARFAERAVTPVLATVIPEPRKADLPPASHSFLSVDAPDVSLLALKLSEAPGRGVIARLHETDGLATKAVNVRIGWGEKTRLTSCSVTEQDRRTVDRSALELAPFGFATLRIEEPSDTPPAPELSVGKCSDKSVTLQWTSAAGACQYYVYRGENPDFRPDEFHLIATTREPQFTDDWLKCGTAYDYRVAAASANTCQGPLSNPVTATTSAQGDSPPAKVGSVYTGLISDPRAWRGDEPDTLYLQWGQNQEPDLSHYELYRGDRPDFPLNDAGFLARVEPGPYVVVPYEDKGLKPHATYYYRVRAIDRDGHKGEPSELCVGTTREMKDE